MQLVKITGPTIDLVGLSSLKEHLKIEHNVDDDLLRNLQKAAYEWVENYIGRTLLTSYWEYTITPFKQNCEVRQALPFPPLCNVESMHQIQPNGKKVALRRFTTEVHHGITYVCFVSQNLPIVINYSAGYGAKTTDVPEVIYLSVKTLTTCWYENREGLGCGIPPAVITLLSPYQIRRLI
jgi:uncharacterized phiE125 gp8 family phage protein